MNHPFQWIAGIGLGAALTLSWACPAYAAEKEIPVAPPSYEEAVPASWRRLVSRESFGHAFAKTRAFNTALPPHAALSMAEMVRIAASPCQQAMLYLMDQYLTNPEVPAALGQVCAGIQELPPDYKQANPWKSSSGAELVRKMLVFFSKWCTNLPQINGSFDNGLVDIQHVSWLSYHNPAGQHFVQGRNPREPSKPLETGLKFTKDFTLQLGAFMDSPASATFIEQWINNPTIEISDYQKQRSSDYATWNQFFARELIKDTTRQIIPSRPVTMPERDYVVVAPTDCIMNPLVQVVQAEGASSRQLLDNPLQANTVLDVKGIPLSITELLTGVDAGLQAEFVGGTGQSCVLMPNTYHHFHAPVDGTIVHASLVKANTFGYFDWPNWVPTDGNVGRPGTDFSQFQSYQRGIFIIELKYKNVFDIISTGYVAVIPVGLESVGSVVLHPDIKVGTKVKKGYTELGNFYYGGSLNLLLYSKGLASGVTHVRMGNQINVLNLGQPIQ